MTPPPRRQWSALELVGLGVLGCLGAVAILAVGAIVLWVLAQLAVNLGIWWYLS